MSFLETVKNFKFWTKAEQDAEAPEKDLAKERIEKCLPVVHQILKLLAESEPKMGNWDSSWDVCYNELAKKILAIMVESDLYYSDKEFIFQLLLQPVEASREYVLKGLGISFDLALKKKFGKDMMDVSLKDLDDVLKS